ncbi:hypothetical protein GN958_ATG14923 [Phytophthora infestans]|uniref:Uncharacterized protein n=1 Tax=Phytophthora infestans TaxID=4787 RepID=A0A8S9U8Z4_PHYIN|nr:hypothetical protein GN958_ATG14923 [Phytophthora infestans]
MGDLHRVITAALVNVKRSPYFMKLKLALNLDGKQGKWSFPMIPEDASAIQKREAEKSAEREIK